MTNPLANGLKSPSQIAKVLTENWILSESYCPCCLGDLTQAPPNAKVLDFGCENCGLDFELKSKKHTLGKKLLMAPIMQ